MVFTQRYRHDLLAELTKADLITPQHMPPEGPRVHAQTLCDELREWADTIETAGEAELHTRARKAAGLTRSQAARLIAHRIAYRAGDPDLMPDLGEAWAILLRDVEVGKGSVWLFPSDIVDLADLYGVRPEYLAGYPLEAPNELVAKISSLNSVPDQKKLIELARMIGGYAPSAQ